MLRWLAIVLTIGLVSSAADAQVFKPKAKKAAATQKKAAPDEDKAPEEKKAVAKKQPRTAPTKKRVTTKKKASRPEGEETSESDSKGSEKDYVKIWDDDVVE